MRKIIIYSIYGMVLYVAAIAGRSKRLEAAPVQNLPVVKLDTGSTVNKVRGHMEIKNISSFKNISDADPSILPGISRRVKLTGFTLLSTNVDSVNARAALYPSLTITSSAATDAFKASNWFKIPASISAPATGSITQSLFQRQQLKLM